VNSYRCRHVIVVKVSGSHFRFRSSSSIDRRSSSPFHTGAALAIVSATVERSTASYEQLPLSTRHCRQRAWKSFPFPVVVDSIGRRSSSPFHTGAAPAIVSASRAIERPFHVDTAYESYRFDSVEVSCFRFRSSSTALVVAHCRRSIRVRLQPSSVLQSSDRRRNTNSYRCRHVIVVNVRGRHFRFRSSSTALVVAHRRRSIRVRLQPSSVLQSSDRRRTNSYRCRHVIVVNVRESHFRFRSSLTALIVAHNCRSIRVRL
jgi:hypothetical protein